jgi:hypothetical protein
MASLDIDGTELVLVLTAMERLGALHGDIRVPLASVKSARTTNDPWSELRGIRAPGAGWPRRIALGTRRGSFGKDFVAVYRDRPVVVIELEGAEFQRFVVSDAHAEATATRLTGQIASPPS